MAIRIRTVNGIRVALCAAETDPEPGDVYLGDDDHHALSAKFTRDYQSEIPHMDDFMRIAYPEEWAAMDSQKKRDAVEDLNRWLAEQTGGGDG